MHEDLEEALAVGIAGKQVYSIQLVLDKDHRVGFAAAGVLEDTFRRAIAVADRQFVLEIERPYEVVVAVAPHPMDCNLYQTNKAIQSGALAVKDGGVLIVVSECPFGLGENQTLFDMLAAADSPARRSSAPTWRSTSWACSRPLASQPSCERAEIWVVTSLRDEDVRAMFMTPFASVQAGRRRRSGQAGRRRPRCSSSRRPASPCPGCSSGAVDHAGGCAVRLRFLKLPRPLGIMRVRLRAGFRVWGGARVAKGSRL